MKRKAFRVLFVMVAAVLLVLATVFDWPYGYYNLLRVAVSFCSAYLAWVATSVERVAWAITFGVLALLFNPFLPVYLTRGIWRVLDIVTAGIMVTSIFTLRLRDAGSLE